MVSLCFKEETSMFHQILAPVAGNLFLSLDHSTLIEDEHFFIGDMSFLSGNVAV
jgi:hypothetical protein